MAEMEGGPVDYATLEKNDDLNWNDDNSLTSAPSDGSILTSSGEDSNGSWNAEDGNSRSKEKSELSTQPEGSLSEKDFGGEMYILDSNRCLEILPEEVWILIAEVSDPTTLENLSNLSSFFRRLLLPQRVNFLFPSVWNILAVKFHEERKKPEEDSDLDSDDEDDDEENFWDWDAPAAPLKIKTARRRQCSCGRVGRARWYSDILTLRLVSNRWADAIDNFYQNQPYYFSIPHDCKDIIASTSCWADITFSSRAASQTQHSFLHHFSKSHGTGNEERSPFLSRRCDIFHQDNADPEEDIFPDMSRLLEKYGHHIWYASIYLTRVTGTLSEWYSILRSLLAEMPNLKGLRITYIYEGEAYREHLGVCQLITQVFLNPLPTLEHLRLLRTENLPTAVFTEIIRRNSHISKLEVEQKPKYNFDPEIYKLPLPNLKDLNMTFISEEEIPKLQRSTETWPLEKLTLDFDEGIQMAWAKLFTLLENKWGSTLTDLDLNLPNNHPGTYNVILKDCASNRLSLPEVKSLQLVTENVTSLDFILPMKDTLEYLKITELTDVLVGSKLYQKVRNEQVIQFLGYRERLLESNIWTLFPKLQRLVLNKDGSLSDDDQVEHTRLEWRKDVERKLMMEQEKRRDIAVQTDTI